MYVCGPMSARVSTGSSACHPRALRASASPPGRKKSRNGLPCGPKSREETPNEGMHEIALLLRRNKHIAAMLLCTKRICESDPKTERSCRRLPRAPRSAGDTRMFRWLTGRAAEPRAALAAMAPAEAKASRTGAIVALHSAGRPVWTARNYAALARAGYMQNPVVHRAVRMVAEAAASVPWLLYDKAAELDRHPLLELLAAPNPRQGGRRADAGALRPPAARRQRLCRGGDGRRARCASCMRSGPTG